MNLKATSLLISLLAASFYGQGQVLSHPQVLPAADEPVLVGMPSHKMAPGETSPPIPLMGGFCTGRDAIGSSSNVFTNILSEANVIAVNNATNTVVFLHRNNATAFGGSSGHMRYDVSTNGGFTWTNNQGPVNPLLTNAARYPNVSIYNPPGNTNPNLARLQYYAPYIVGAAWSGIVSGGRNLDGTSNTENYNQAGATQTLIPRGLTQGAPGVFWAVDYVFTGTASTGFRIHKGTHTGADVTWAVNTTITPAFNTAFDGTNKVSDIDIAFDPSGMKGWVVMLSHLTAAGSSNSFYPCFWSTTDGGATWSGPEVFDVTNPTYTCISANIAVGNVASTGFDLNLVVDAKGNPHAFVPICNGNNAYAVFYTSWHHVFDITKEAGVWNAIDVANINAGRTTYGVAPNTVDQDFEPQASRSDDGTKVFFTWLGSESSITLGGTNTAPNLWGASYDVMTRTWATAREMTTCNPSTAGKSFFPKMAPTVLGTSSPWRMPVVTAEMTSSDPIAIANFFYLDSLAWFSSDYSTPQCTVSNGVNAGDTITICEGDSVILYPLTSADAYWWSTGVSTFSAVARDEGWVYLGYRSGCCTGFDSVFIAVNDTVIADFMYTSGGLTYSFSDGSAGQPDSWAWDFGDGGTSTLQNPGHSYASEGTYIVCLTATDFCGSNTICDTVVVDCPDPAAGFTYIATTLTVDFTDASTGGTTYSWDFGDGGTSTLMSPSHTYSLPGGYVVCLTVTDTCGSNTFCDTISVACVAPSAAYTWADMGLGVVDFTNTSTGGTTYSWDFGDGGTSMLASPSHTYAADGSYVVCLTVSDSCGSDTRCDTVYVIIESLDNPALGGLRVYPNPANDRVMIDGYLSRNGAITITLSNALGQKLIMTPLIQQSGMFKHELSLNGIAPGIYFLEMASSIGRSVVKLTVQ